MYEKAGKYQTTDDLEVLQKIWTPYLFPSLSCYLMGFDSRSYDMLPKMYKDKELRALALKPEEK
jgi:hypothetical protein